MKTPARCGPWGVDFPPCPHCKKPGQPVARVGVLIFVWCGRCWSNNDRQIYFVETKEPDKEETVKIRVNVTVDVDAAQVKTLVELAKTTGHDHDGVNTPARLIRRYLESKVADAVTYCHEHLTRD